MQTFLPYSDFEKTMSILDYRRLGKQRVEANIVLNILTGNYKSKSWVRHPIIVMWRGFEEALALYIDTAIKEWVRRGYNNTMKFRSSNPDPQMPSWMGSPAFHRSHQSNLVRKYPEHYRIWFPEVPNDLPYIWPS